MPPAATQHTAQEMPYFGERNNVQRARFRSLEYDWIPSIFTARRKLKVDKKRPSTSRELWAEKEERIAEDWVEQEYWFKPRLLRKDFLTVLDYLTVSYNSKRYITNERYLQIRSTEVRVVFEFWRNSMACRFFGLIQRTDCEQIKVWFRSQTRKRSDLFQSQEEQNRISKYVYVYLPPNRILYYSGGRRA